MLKPVYSQIQAMDEVFTWDRGLFARIIRRMSAPRKPQNKVSKVAVHCGIVVDVGVPNHPLYYIVEACGTEQGRVRINPFKKYTQKGFFKPKLLCIKRYPQYYDPNVRESENYNLLKKAQEYIKYDYCVIPASVHDNLNVGELKLKMPSSIKNIDKNKNYYCSELCRAIRQRVNVFFQEKDKGVIYPYDLQISDRSDVVKGALADVDG